MTENEKEPTEALYFLRSPAEVLEFLKGLAELKRKKEKFHARSRAA